MLSARSAHLFHISALLCIPNRFTPGPGIAY